MEQKEEIYPFSKINDLIYLSGSSHVMQRTEEFEKAKIDIIINCAEEVNFTDDIMEEFCVEKYGFYEEGFNSLLDYIDEVDSSIVKHLKKRKRILLCCSDGNSRAPAVLIHYLMFHQGRSFFDAKDEILRIRKTVDLNPGFENELMIMNEY